jgi:hypothetical protein
MPDVDMPILVVDDAKFSSAIIAKALRGRGRCSTAGARRACRWT